VIKYIGSKRALIPALLDVFAAVAPAGSVADLFSGTSRVGHALKGRGYRVIANDHNAYAATLARCYVQADLEEHGRAAAKLVEELNALPGRPGYFTEVFCERSRFFQPKNGARVDAIREEIARKSLDPELESVLLTSLMEAADRVDSTTGLQMAYLKQWAPRASNDLRLRLPELLPRASSGKGEAWQLEAEEAVQRLQADVFYLDPPYNQHKYLGNYHVWESLVLWDKPDVYGVACKRVDCRERTSRFNSKTDAREALRRVISGARCRHLVVSFNNEGYLGREDIEAMLATRGDVAVLSHDFRRYVGAQIGIHDPSGAKVGEVSHLRNTEHIYVASPDPDVIRRVRALGDAPPARSPDARPAPVEEIRVALERLLAERGTVSAAEARDALGADPGVVRAAFRSLIASGAVTRIGATKGARYAPTGAR
jgi:adenine-specific DNA-methyltransferase